MMYQGLFGAFPFTVAEAEVCTFRDFKLSRELVFAEHKTLDGLSRLQHTGRNLDPASLTVQIVPLGTLSTVNLRLRALDALARLGQELPLVIGLKYHGLFVLKSYEVTHRQLHFGVCLAAEVALSLLEYN
ncbi:MAG: phage tail protein [Desulfovibrio sp.]|nr:phage tail protein [Desulfovibrio sp.]